MGREGKGTGIDFGRTWAWCRKNPVPRIVFAAGTVAGAVSAVVFEFGPEDMAT